MKVLSVDPNAVKEMIRGVIENDINDLLDKVTEEAIEKIKHTIRKRVAIQVMSRIEESYNLSYDGRDLRILVKFIDSK